MQTHHLATTFLRQMDADWATLIATIGDCQFASKPQRDPYEALVRAVAYQQLSTKAGDAILGKFLMHFNAFPKPEILLNASFDHLRSCGFSGRKIETLHGIASGAVSGLVPSLAEARELSDAELIARLVTLKGIGQWTVEMMLMFTLTRMDILPVTDLGILQGYQRLKNLARPPKPKQMAEIGLAWQPYRTVASWYLWRVPK